MFGGGKEKERAERRSCTAEQLYVNAMPNFCLYATSCQLHQKAHRLPSLACQDAAGHALELTEQRRSFDGWLAGCLCVFII